MIKKLSLRRKLFIYINILFFTSIIIISAILISRSNDQSRFALHEKVNKAVIDLKSASVSFIWNFEYDLLETLSLKEVEDRDIKEIQFFDPQGKPLVDGLKITNDPNIKYITEELSYDGESIGKFILGYSEDYVKANIRKSAILVLILVVCFQILVSVIVHFATISITGPLNKIIETLHTLSTTMYKISNELSESSTNLASTAEQQASSLVETSASLEELAAMINKNLEGSESANKLLSNVEESTKVGSSAMGDLSGSMEDITASNESIKQLFSIIKEIDTKTAIIDEIVFQTKLLSFNASVEAERAGEHGRGFAVVAQEVGKLAELSGKSALEIRAIVKDSLEKTEAITSNNENKVEQGGEQTNRVSVILKEIEGKTLEANKLSTQILLASKEQSVGIDSINGAMQQLEQSTAQSSSVSHENDKVGQTLKNEVSKLNEIVTILKGIVFGA